MKVFGEKRRVSVGAKGPEPSFGTTGRAAGKVQKNREALHGKTSHEDAGEEQQHRYYNKVL